MSTENAGRGSAFASKVGLVVSPSRGALRRTGLDRPTLAAQSAGGMSRTSGMFSVRRMGIHACLGSRTTKAGRPLPCQMMQAGSPRSMTGKDACPSIEMLLRGFIAEQITGGPPVPPLTNKSRAGRPCPPLHVSPLTSSVPHHGSSPSSACTMAGSVLRGVRDSAKRSSASACFSCCMRWIRCSTVSWQMSLWTKTGLSWPMR